MSAFKYFIILVLMPFSILCQTPENANNWFWGNGNHIKFMKNTIEYENLSNVDFTESTTSYSDSIGNLIIYYNNTNIYDKFNNVIENGSNIKGYFSSSQSSLILKHNYNDSILFLITNIPCNLSLDEGVYLTKIRYKNNSLIVIEKNIKLSNKATEKLNAVQHHNGNDIWIVSHQCDNNVFDFFLLQKNGVSKCWKSQSIGSVINGNSTTASYLKFSYTGDFLAHTTFNKGTLELFKFNNKEAVLSDSVLLYESFTLGVEFSPNEKYLYLRQAINNNYSQFNISNFNSNSIGNSKRILYSNNNPMFGNSLQLGPDKKIYFSMRDSLFLGCIQEPDKTYDSCKFNTRYLSLNGNKSYSELPNFNQSYFYTPAVNYSYELNCTKNRVQFWGKDTFGANSHTWHSRQRYPNGNWELIGNTKDINYTFADTGTYEVRYIASNGNKADTVVKSILLYDKIKKGFLGKDTVFAQGDIINKTLIAPSPNHCVRWYDLTPNPSPKERGTGSSLLIDSVGTYICKVTNQAFCEVWDTIVISECINNLHEPSLFRSRDTLRTWHLNADSFVWYRNNQVYHISKEPFLALTDTGTYRVEAAKKGHCNSGSIGTNYVQRLNVKGIRIEDLGIKVFPNPSSGVVRIESNNSFKFEVFDISGRVIDKGENNNELSLPKGIYFLKFDVSGYKVTEKLIVLN
jgi:hypothetical protein